MESLAYELSKAGATCARRAADSVMATQAGRVCFVAGAHWTTTRTSSISTDVNSSAARGVTYDELVAAYTEQGPRPAGWRRGCSLGRNHFDTLNAKAASSAIEKIFRGAQLPRSLMHLCLHPGGEPIAV